MVEFLRVERKKQRISIRELAELSGVNQRTISNWEYSGIMPTIENFQKVLNALGYDLRIVKKE